MVNHFIRTEKGIWIEFSKTIAVMNYDCNTFIKVVAEIITEISLCWNLDKLDRYNTFSSQPK